MCKQVGFVVLAAIVAAGCLAISDHPSKRGELSLSSAQAYANRNLSSVTYRYAAPTSVVQCAGTIGHGFC